jgi:photosystem II stability/assembly factor-like uncharacterized protein
LLPLGRDTIVVAGKYGFLLRTVDQGLTWDYYCHETRNGNRSFSFSSATDGIAQAYDQASGQYPWYGTEDGCKSWRLLGEDALIRNAVLYQIDRSRIWAVDARHLHQDSLIFLSIDGGEHWVPKCVGAEYDSVALITMEGGLPNCGSDSLIILTNKGILRTVDQGMHWQIYPQIRDLLTTGGAKVGYAGLYANSGRSQWLHRSDKILVSRDYGMTWQTVMQLPDSAIAGGSNYNSMSVDGDVVHVSLDSRQKVFPVIRIVMFHSSDAGMTWESYAVDYDYKGFFLGVPFLHNTFASGTGYALEAGASNYFAREDAVYKTTDAWRTYSIAFAVSIAPENIGSGRTLKFFDENHGWLAIGNAIYATSNGGVDWVESNASVPSEALLAPVYPNPASANAAVRIVFSVTGDRSTSITIDVHDIMGRKVRDQYAATALPGRHELRWDARGAAPGVYIVRLAAGKRCEVRKVILR